MASSSASADVKPELSSSSSSSSSAASAAAAAPSRPVLFWGSGSPPAWRVCAVLLEKGVDFDGRRVQFDSGFLKTPEFLALNPRGLVPSLIDGDLVLYESLAILHYLEDKYPAVRLIPKEPAAKARCLMRMQEANNASSAAGEVVYYVRRTRPESINFPYLRCKFAVLAEELKLWESYLAGAEYLAGPGQGVSLADFAFFPNLAYMVRLGLELEPNYPNLKAYFCRMCARKSILASWPPHWLKSHGLPCLSSSILPPVEGATREACEAVAASAGAGSVPPTDVPCSRMNTADRCPVSARDVVAAAARGEESPAKC
ncbi:hypothetical protein FNF29_03778 [Cafeteria roenbergensis]|uniref:GST N-terminal domain-containing protein n=1 Tax=Cafeteria roenbergensis TaxID=33653 RepID=A0A5A8CL65_CAFRO|nr:hypothetical protein FNF29_03778 [Cafeteria roenbergensis]|eukprot:KAA0152551.1 hypothetical protein FNF29_03778 [Cafeteria roenbergensis]